MPEQAKQHHDENRSGGNREGALLSFVDEKHEDIEEPGIQPSSSTSMSMPTKADSLGPYDILCGRTKAAFHNIGNRRFRVTMSINLHRYMEMPTKQAKTMFIKELVHLLKDKVGVRFLKEAERSSVSLSSSRTISSENGDGDVKYIELTNKQARDKVSHSLRDLALLHQRGRQSSEAIKNVQQNGSATDTTTSTMGGSKVVGRE